MNKFIITGFLALVSLLSVRAQNLEYKKMYRAISNATDHEIAPAITADGDMIVFYTQDFSKKWFVEYSKKMGSKWRQPEGIALLDKWHKLNLTGGHCITPDGKTIYFSTKKYPNVGSYDIWKITQTSSGWGAPENLAKPVCSEMADVNPFVTADGNHLYFIRSESADDNEGACGKIFRSEKNGPSWSAPKEVPVGNGCVTRAIMAADNETLFFSQKEGGSHNVYVARFQNNKWSTPVPFKSFNTDKNDLFFTMYANADFIFFSRKIEETHDLYMAKIPDNLKPKQVYWEDGKLVSESGNELNGYLYIHDAETGKKLDEQKVIQGDYNLFLNEGKNYKYYFVSRDKGYYFTSGMRDMKGSQNYVKKSEKRVLKNLDKKFMMIDMTDESKAYALDFEYYNNMLKDNSKKFEVVASGPQPDPIYDTIQVFDHLEYEIGDEGDTLAENEVMRDSISVTIPPRIDYSLPAIQKLQELGMNRENLVILKPEDIKEIEDETEEIKIYVRLK